MLELLAQGNMIVPELLLCLCGILILIVELAEWKWKNTFNLVITVLYFAAVLIVLGMAVHSHVTQTIFRGAYIITPFISSGKLLIAVAGILTILASGRYVRIHDLNLSEYLHFLTFSTLGMFILLSANDFLILFLGLELLSFPIYVLTGMKVKNERSCEAGLKYMVMGAFSSALLLFGIGLIYGAIGTTALGQFIEIMANPQGATLFLGIILLLVAIGFKLSIVPFHAWTPDVYEGAPTAITAFMSVTMKVAVFFIFIRLFANLSLPILVNTVAALALLSIIVGNFYGLVQENVKRLLAYSAIAHAGYIMLGFLDVAHREEATYGMVFYLVNYTFMNLAALFVLVYLTTKEKYVETLNDLKGVGWRQPLLGLVMIVALFSLCGLPPTPGFIAKFYVFKSALQGGYVITVVLALISTLISLYYYIKILIVMYMEEVPEYPPARYSLSVALTMVIATVALFYLALFPNQILTILPAIK